MAAVFLGVRNVWVTSFPGSSGRLLTWMKVLEAHPVSNLWWIPNDPKSRLVPKYFFPGWPPTLPGLDRLKPLSRSPLRNLGLGRGLKCRPSKQKRLDPDFAIFWEMCSLGAAIALGGCLARNKRLGTENNFLPLEWKDRVEVFRRFPNENKRLSDRSLHPTSPFADREIFGATFPDENDVVSENCLAPDNL